MSALAGRNAVGIVASARDSAPSLSRTASGAGIGLFVSRQLIAAMGGRMWAAIREQVGREFGFELPVFEATD